MKGILGIKIGMTQIFADDGKVVPVTVVKAGPCQVVQRKTAEGSLIATADVRQPLTI